MMKRVYRPSYQKLGTIVKREGLQLYEYSFDENLLNDGETEVFVKKRPSGEKEKKDELPLAP